MTLQNRVLPNSRIVALPQYRGTYMGNRGCLHNDQRQLMRQSCAAKRWILCATEFKNRKRTLMTPGEYTELFFLDEATGLAAGHRPCYECRRSAAKHFKLAWLAGNPQSGLSADCRIDELDKQLDADRRNPSGKPNISTEEMHTLPSGTMVADQTGDGFYLLHQQRLYQWTASGYRTANLSSEQSGWQVITPDTTVNALRHGYQPTSHPTLIRLTQRGAV